LRETQKVAGNFNSRGKSAKASGRSFPTDRLKTQNGLFVVTRMLRSDTSCRSAPGVRMPFSAPASESKDEG
jgi:hypothetical protein